jgi:hypothetical protein
MLVNLHTSAKANMYIVCTLGEPFMKTFQQLDLSKRKTECMNKRATEFISTRTQHKIASTKVHSNCLLRARQTAPHMFKCLY